MINQCAGPTLYENLGCVSLRDDHGVRLALVRMKNVELLSQRSGESWIHTKSDGFRAVMMIIRVVGA